MNKRVFAAICAALAAVSCTVTIDEQEPGYLMPDEILLSVPGADGATKVDYSVSGGVMSGVWSEGDAVCVTPGMKYKSLAKIYTVSNPGSASGTFVSATGGFSSGYKLNAVYYPGESIKSFVQYYNWSYLGQTQTKADPMAHVKDYYSFYAAIPSTALFGYKYETSSLLSLATEFHHSSCMKINLSGMTFENPTAIKVSISGGLFYTTNINPTNSYYVDDDETYPTKTSVSTLTLDLSGYGTEESLEAYLMMSDKDIEISEDGCITVTVECGSDSYSADVRVPSGITLHGGNMHLLNIDSGWTKAGPDYTDYEWDGDVVTLQEGVPGLDLVLMGDGFIAADFEGEDDGRYGALMREAAEQFFTDEPVKSYRDKFCVYYVKAVSPERTLANTTGANGAENTGTETKFSVQFTANSTNISGDNDTVEEYATKAFPEATASSRLRNATIIVIVNQACHAGTCHHSFVMNDWYDYARARGIAYCALGLNLTQRHELVRHEATGHGFGDYADEYFYSSNSGYKSDTYTKLAKYHHYGMYRNVDPYCNDYIYDQWSGYSSLSSYEYVFQPTTTANVYWKDLFGTGNGYETIEDLGVFQGAYTRKNDACRPTENGDCSIMSGDEGIFNAPARRAAYYRLRRLSGEVTSNIWGTEQELSDFLAFDAAILDEIAAKYSAAKSASTSSSAKLRASVGKSGDESLPLPPPVDEFGHWEDGKFIVEGRVEW